MNEADWLQLTALSMAAVLVVPAALRSARGRRLLFAAIWLGVIVALVYAYQAFNA